MFARTVWEATPGSTPLHKLDARAKLISLACWAVATVTIDSPRSLFLLFGLTLCLHLAARSSFARWRVLMLIVLLGIWGSMTSQALFYSRDPRTVIACLLPPATPLFGPLTGGIFVYREGLEYGAVQALRSATMLSMGLLVSWTSDPRQLLRSFLSWRMPYELAFMLITALRFLPVIFQETAVVLTAQRLRGFQPLRTLSPRRLLQTAFQTLFPILGRTLRRAATLAASVESRGFGRDSRCLEHQPWPAASAALCVTALLATAALLAFKTVDVLQYNGIVYFAGWRTLYDIMKVWM
ncbi:MAG: energy-coupling factor transporter transmembrane component T [Sporomusaceae bacterium]|nr:energy-coupling factor transporter transmembrane component T [Sporomusaceae bacterium]